MLAQTTWLGRCPKIRTPSSSVPSNKYPSHPIRILTFSAKQNANKQIKILAAKAVETMSVEGFPVISVTAQVEYMGNKLTVPLRSCLGIANQNTSSFIYDADRHGGKGHHKGIQFFKYSTINIILSIIAGKNCSQQKEIDTLLSQQLAAHQNKGLYQVNILSYLSLLLQSTVSFTPLFKVVSTLAQTNVQSVHGLNLMVNALQGSKVVASKCKVFKYILIADNVQDGTFLQTVVQAVRKAITSGKGGEAALKFHSDGTFICPLDTIADNLKIVEDAIVSTNNKDKVTIGLSWMAENFYNPDQKKYELENPKALLDTDQLIDYYVKLITDKPIITYLEDPLIAQDPVGWNKLSAKLAGKVKFGSRKLYSTIENTKKVAHPVSKETHPELDDNAIKDLNDKRINLDLHYYRAFELETVSKLLEMKKNLKPSKVLQVNINLNINFIQTTMILADNVYETDDTLLVDVCAALGSYLLMGPCLKYDRISKLNRIKELTTH